MNIYCHLSPEERAVNMIEHNKHCSIRKIAQTLSRSVSTISRELKRNSVASKATYCATNARHKYDARREKCVKPEKLTVGCYLYRVVKSCLLDKQWSPEQISGTLKKWYPLNSIGKSNKVKVFTLFCTKGGVF